MTTIKDGTGSGYNVKVDNNYRMWTRTVSDSRAQESSILGAAYNVSTGIINLTVNTESALLYYKHQEEKDLIIGNIIVGVLANGTDSNPTSLLKIVRNPTAGTIVSGASAMSIMANRNFNVGAVLPNSIAYKGANNLTLTDGTVWSYDYIAPARTSLPVDIILKQGNSIGVTLDLQANTGTVGVYVSFYCHLQEDS